MLEGTEADEDQCRRYAESSSAIVTPLNRLIGYEEAAKIAKTAMKERKTIREVIDDERLRRRAASSPRSSSTTPSTCCR